MMDDYEKSICQTKEQCCKVKQDDIFHTENGYLQRNIQGENNYYDCKFDECYHENVEEAEHNQNEDFQKYEDMFLRRLEKEEEQRSCQEDQDYGGHRKKEWDEWHLVADVFCQKLDQNKCHITPRKKERNWSLPANVRNRKKISNNNRKQNTKMEDFLIGADKADEQIGLWIFKEEDDEQNTTHEYEIDGDKEDEEMEHALENESDLKEDVESESLVDDALEFAQYTDAAEDLDYWTDDDVTSPSVSIPVQSIFDFDTGCSLSCDDVDGDEDHTFYSSSPDDVYEGRYSAWSDVLEFEQYTDIDEDIDYWADDVSDGCYSAWSDYDNSDDDYVPDEYYCQFM